MKKFLYLIIFVIITCFISTKQVCAQTIQGIVVEEKQPSPPLEFVNVTLFDADNKPVSSAQTDKNGHFSIKLQNINDTKFYSLQLSFIGYITQRIKLSLSNTQMNLGVLRLKEEDNVMKEVVVNGKGKIMADGYTIFPTKQVKFQSSNGFELIQKLMIPDISVDSYARKVQTTSGGKVLILINDKKASIEEVLTLHPQLTKKIEYIDAPGIEYAADGYDAVVKLYVSQPEAGLMGELSLANAFTTIGGENFAFLKYNNKLSEFGITFENEYTHTKQRSISQQDFLKLTDQNILNINREGLESPIFYMQNRITLHYNHTAPQKHIFNLSVANNWYNSPKRLSIQKVTEPSYEPYLTTTSPTEVYYSPIIDLFYLIHTKHGGTISYNAHATYIYTDYSYLYRENHPEGDDHSYSYQTKGDKRSIINEIKYEKQFKHFALTSGGRYLYGHTKNHYVGKEDEIDRLSNHDLYVYSQLAGKWKIFMYNIGLGLNYLKTVQINEKTSSWLMRPRLSLAVPLKSWTIQYNMNIDPVSASLSMLSEVSQQSNRWDVNTGNPLLKSYNILVNKLTIRKQIGSRLLTSTQLGFETARNPIVPTIQRNTVDDNTIFIHSFVNAGTKRKTWVTVGAQWQVLPNILRVKGICTYKHSLVENYLYKHQLNNLNYMLEADLTIGKWNFMAAYNNKNKELIGEEEIIDNSNLNLSLRYRIGSFAIGLHSTNAFHALGRRRQTRLLNDQRSYYQDLRVPSTGNMIAIYLTWNFSRGRKHTTGSQNIHNNDSDTGILKF